MAIAKKDLLAGKACRAILRDHRYSRPRMHALVHWLKSDFAPTRCVARNAVEKLGHKAFVDLLLEVRDAHAPSPEIVGALPLFPEEFDRTLNLLWRWLAKSRGKLRRTCIVSIAYILAEKLRRKGKVNMEKVNLIRPMLVQISKKDAVLRIHLRDFDRAVAGAE